MAGDILSLLLAVLTGNPLRGGLFPLSSTCAALANASFPVKYATSADYAHQQSLYWNAAASEMLPACILVPQTPADVSTIVKTLGRNKERFAIKGGGHCPNLNFASIANGPLISLSNFTEVTYDAKAGTVRVGAGNRWEDVQAALDPHNVAVAGGRVGHVGVGGYMLGLGFSFHASQYGWAANSLIAADMVLANGTFVTASNTSHPELFAALKGGSNNFGVVTTYILTTHPGGKIYGGEISIIVDSPATEDAVLAAIYNFTATYADHPKAAIIPNREAIASGNTTAPLTHLWIIFLFYDGATPPGGTFDMFTSIKGATNSATTQALGTFLKANDFGTGVNGQRNIFSTETFPLPHSDGKGNSTAVLRSYLDQYLSLTESLAHAPGLLATMSWEPFPRIAAQAALDRGSDLLAVEADVDRMFLQIGYGWSSGADDDRIRKGVLDTETAIRNITDGFVKNGAMPDAYRPLFMNDAHAEQDYFGRMKSSSRDFAKRIANEVDPEGLFRTRTYGFRP